MIILASQLHTLDVAGKAAKKIAAAESANRTRKSASARKTRSPTSVGKTQKRVVNGSCKDQFRQTDDYRGLISKYLTGQDHMNMSTLSKGWKGISDKKIAKMIKDGSFLVHDGKDISYDEDKFLSMGEVHEKITDVAFRPGITKIGKYAFAHCGNLKTVNIPEGITHISEDAFDQCDSLERVTFPASLKTIGDGVFASKHFLREIDLSHTAIRVLGDSVFQFCEALTTVKLPGKLEEIGAETFDHCGKISSIAFPETLRRIGEGAFNGSRMKRIDLGHTKVTVLSKQSFSSNLELVHMKLPNELEEIGEEALADCRKWRQKDIFFPRSLKRIGTMAFWYNSSMKALDFRGTSLISVGENAFEGCAELDHVAFPEPLNRVGKDAFGGCKRLRSIIVVQGAIKVTPQMLKSWSPRKGVKLLYTHKEVDDAIRLAKQYIF